MFRVEDGVVVEGDGAGGGVEVEGGDDEVGEADVGVGLCEEGEGGDEAAAVVVGLVVEDYAGVVGGKGCWRHGRVGVMRVMRIGGIISATVVAFFGVGMGLMKGLASA